MPVLLKELRHSARQLIRRPGFTIAILLLLILGIGSNTAIFTLLNAVFLDPLPALEEQDRLVTVYGAVLGPQGSRDGHHRLSYDNYLDFEDRSGDVFDQLALQSRSWLNLSGGDEAQRLIGLFVTPNYFAALGLAPAAGRFFLPEEEREGEGQVVVLSHGCWHRLFAGDRNVIGSQVEVNGAPVTIVGVAPEGFKGTQINAGLDLWIPVSMFEQLSSFGHYFDQRATSLFLGVGRLADGVTIEQADAALVRIADQLRTEHPVDNEDRSVRLEPLVEGTILPREQDAYIGYRNMLSIGVALLLVVACLNIGTLLTIRGLSRAKELAVRQALGACRRQVARPLIVENALLFFIGGLLSIPVGWWSLQLLWRFRPPELIHDAVDLRLDARVLLFTGAMTLLCCLLFGVLPALRITGKKLQQALTRNGSAGVAAVPGAGRSRWQPRSLLAMLQVAFALVSLVAAGIFLRNLERVRNIDLGFDAQPLAVFTVGPGDQGRDQLETRQYFDRLVERLSNLPGVGSAAVSENRLLRGAVLQNPVFVDGAEELVTIGGRRFHRTNGIGPGFFATVGIEIEQGRDFDRGDCADCVPVVIVNRTMAEALWPGSDPIGRQIRYDPGEDPITVVGVAENATYRYLDEENQFFLYRPLAQTSFTAATVHVAVEGDPLQALPALRETAHELGPNLAIADLAAMSSFVDNALWMERMSASVLALFGLLALLLSMIGIYSVMAFAVAQRRMEIGIRLALGARRSRVLWSVLGEAVVVVAGGVVLGAGLSYFVLRPLIESQVHSTGGGDPGSYLVLALLLTAAALLGSYLPAHRAATTPPAIPLRSE